jgi:DNA polymerase-3 subunit epsilon
MLAIFVTTPIEMLYAIVDIETTGSYAAGAGITEVAVVVHDGREALSKWSTLVNPQRPIPRYIQGLTGITEDMVMTAPPFEEVAATLAELLRGKVFVAHNVNFDYSFVKHHLDRCGYPFEARKLCTIRYARKVIPGLKSYGLGNICPTLGIDHFDHHRALGDAEATSRLFSYLIEKDERDELALLLKGRNREQYLPPNVPVEQVDALPNDPGVYYFYNAAGKAIYVGKAINLQQRVRSHFSNNKISRQKSDFLREVHRISYTPVATDLMAHVLESVEIRKLWPTHNRSQKGYHPRFGLFSYEDRNGYVRLTVEKHRANMPALYTFNTLTEGYRQLRLLSEEFGLCPRLAGLAPEADCTGKEPAEGCTGTCSEEPLVYNNRVQTAIDWISKHLPTFALIDRGRHEMEQSCILVRQGNLCAMGYLPVDDAPRSLDKLLERLEPLPDNDYIRSLVYKHATEYPEKVVQL